jgi:hypothetical protein
MSQGAEKEGIDHYLEEQRETDVIQDKSKDGSGNAFGEGLGSDIDESYHQQRGDSSGLVEFRHVGEEQTQDTASNRAGWNCL